MIKDIKIRILGIPITITANRIRKVISDLVLGKGLDLLEIKLRNMGLNDYLRAKVMTVIRDFLVEQLGQAVKVG